MSKVIWLLFISAAAWLVVVPLLTEGAPISCGDVTKMLAPCFMYVMQGGMVPSNCCAGVKSLNSVATTTPVRRYVCACLKSVTGSASAAVVRNAKSLPGKCGVNLSYEITPSIDCTKVT